MATLKSTLSVGDDKVYPKTSADQVTFGSNSNVQAKLNALTTALEELTARVEALEPDEEPEEEDGGQ